MSTEVEPIAEKEFAATGFIRAVNPVGTTAVGQVRERARWQRRYAANLRLTDTLVVAAAVAAAQYLRFGTVTTATTDYAGILPTAFSIALTALWLAFLVAFRTRSPRFIGAGIEEYRRVIAASLWMFLLLAVAELLLKLELSRGYLVVAFGLGISGLLLSRLMWRKYAVRQHRNGRFQTAVLAIGELDAVAHFAAEVVADVESGYRLVGACVLGADGLRGDHLTVDDVRIPIVGGEGHALRAIHSLGADTVVIAGAGRLGCHDIRRLSWQLEPIGVDLLMAPGVMDVAASRLTVRPIGGMPLLSVGKPQYRGAKRSVKRAFDVCFSAFALVLAMPVLLLAALAIKLTSRGPVLYTAERIGIDGTPFAMFKLRTMVEDADQQLAALLDRNESDGVLFKIRDDPRITPVGRILRKYSIDELPQLVNVLRGEMSIVGPRPPLKREVDSYDSDVQRRLLVRPGITGLWQVSGRADLLWDKAVRLDLSYVDNWSMVGDIVIIAKTVQAVYKSRGAY